MLEKKDYERVGLSTRVDTKLRLNRIREIRLIFFLTFVQDNLLLQRPRAALVNAQPVVIFFKSTLCLYALICVCF
jgi:hypothetical protein